MENNTTKQQYSAPQAEVTVLKVEGIVCQSPTSATLNNVWEEIEE